MQPKQATMQDFMIRIEKVLISDEEFVRLLKYPPMGFDETSQMMIPDPLDESLPDLVDDSDEYWELVSDRFRKGLKRTDIENDATVIVYMYEGRRRPVFNNYLLVTQEINFSIFIQEVFEADYRISRISDRISHLLTHKSELAGIGQLEFSNGNPREAPIGYRRYDVSYIFNTNKKAR